MTTTSLPVNGDPRQRREDEIAALLLLLAYDDAAAGKLWRRHVPVQYAGLLNLDGFTWDAQQYANRHGRPVDAHQTKRLSLVLIGSVAMEMQDEAKQMALGIKPIGTWQEETERHLGALWVAQAALAVGGFSRLTTEDRTRIAGHAPGTLGFVLDRLALFAAAVAIGADRADTEEAVVYRAGLYPMTSTWAYEELRRDAHKRARDEAGLALYTQERNILGIADHCDECPELTDMGWMPIGTMPVPGLRQCLMHCHCSMEYRKDLEADL